jgi:chromosome segregation ATPase
VNSASETEIENVRSEKLGLTASVEELRRNVAEAESTVKKLKNELKAAKQQLKSAEMSAVEPATALKSDHERIVESLEQRRSALRHELNDHIDRLSEQLATGLETIWAHEETIGNQQRMFGHNHEVPIEKTNEVAEVEKAKAKAAVQSEAERKSVVENYEAEHS